MSEKPCTPCEQGENSPGGQSEVHAPQDVAIFAPPPATALKPGIIIEFCDRCRWLHRATWTQTELMLTFPPPALLSVSLVPLNSPETGGRFRVWLTLEQDTVLLWDRKSEGGFPELKNLKQRVRDKIDPGRGLGHSDKDPKK